MIIPFDLRELCTEVRKVSRNTARWFTVRRAWRLLVRLSRRKYAKTVKRERERRWTLLRKQVDAMIEWHVSKRKPAAETSDAVVRELVDWLVKRYGEDIHETAIDPPGGYTFQARHLTTGFYVGVRSANGLMNMWMLGVTTWSHLSYVTGAGLITRRFPDVPDGGTVLVKLDVHDQDTYHGMEFTQTTSNGMDYLVSVLYNPKQKGYFKVALRTLLDLGRVGTDEPVEPLTPFKLV